jgi:AraC family transcriptional regulator, ethanolamine operon transcriptional activator
MCYPKSESLPKRRDMQAQSSYQRLTYRGLEPSQAFDVVYGTQFEHRLLAAGTATLLHQRLTLPGLRLETGAYDFPVAAFGAMPRDVVCLGLMAAGVEVTRYNAQAVHRDEIQLYPPGVDMLYHASAASRWIALTVAQAALQDAVLQRAQRPLDLQGRSIRNFRLPRGRREALVLLTDDAFAVARAQGEAGLSDALAAQLADSLLGAFVDALCSAHGSSAPAGQHHLQLVLACERLVAQSADGPLSLDEVVRRSGYGRRALELIFSRSVGAPPGRWFMVVRLNGALRDLLGAAPGCRVADVAARWGFRHLPRFAEQYRRAFGELPSRTLQRSLAG